VRDAVWSVDPATQSVSLTPLSARVEQSIVNLRLLAWLLGLFAAAATLVVVFGLASSLAATFVELRRELGIRAALGASPRRLAYSSIRWAVLAVLCSATLTLPASVVIGNLLRIDKAPIGWDARGWLLSSLILAAIGIAAAWLPAPLRFGLLRRLLEHLLPALALLLLYETLLLLLLLFHHLLNILSYCSVKTNIVNILKFVKIK
jgi:hypothetical protein